MPMDYGFWVEVPDGSGRIVATFRAFDPELGCDEGGDLELFLLADSRAAGVERARTYGIMNPSLKRSDKDFWITDEDVQAVLSSKTGAVWRRGDLDRDERPGQYRKIEQWPGTLEQRRR
jgi:hypothetical protein